MTHHTLQAGAPNLPLSAGMILKLEARSVTVDGEVLGAVGARWSIYGYDQGAQGAGGVIVAPDPLLVPELTST